MKKLIIALCALLAATSLLGALAATGASANASVILRTGPSARFDWVTQLARGTQFTAVEQETGDDGDWVLVEFRLGQDPCRAYAPRGSLRLNASVPWAAHLWQTATVSADCQVLAAPRPDATWRAELLEEDYVTVLDYEGDYAFVEFYDRLERLDCRGYVEAWLVDGADYGYSYDGMEGGYSGGYGIGSIGINIGPADDYDYGYDGFEDDDYEYMDAAYDYIPGVEATPNQELALRGCPLRQSVWLGHMPEDTDLIAYEYEKGNGVTWVLVEYYKDGAWQRGYTGLKRMSVHGSIPWADHLNREVRANQSTAIFGAPDYDSAYRGWMEDGDYVTLLEYDGDFAFIEFYDAVNEDINRGYVPAWTVD